MLSFTPVVGIGTPPTPHPQASVSPPYVPGGAAHSLARKGLGESRFRRGDIHCGIVYTYIYFMIVIGGGGSKGFVRSAYVAQANERAARVRVRVGEGRG